MMNNKVSGTIAGWKIKEFKLLRDLLKRKFETGAVDSLGATAKCDLDVLPVAAKVRSGKQMLWGKSFNELKQALSDKFRTSLGLWRAAVN